MAALLYSGSFRLCVFSFLLISCFLDLTMAELLSVSLLKKAGGWLVLPGDLEPILLRGQDTQVSSLVLSLGCRHLSCLTNWEPSLLLTRAHTPISQGPCLLKPSRRSPILGLGGSPEPQLPWEATPFYLQQPPTPWKWPREPEGG